MYLTVTIAVDVVEGLLVDGETVCRAAQRRPHLLVEFAEMRNVLPIFNVYACDTADCREFPVVFTV